MDKPISKIEKIAVNVVTYNRKGLLLECLKSLLKQTYPLNAIYIIDNASTDGTYELLKKEGYVKETKNNPKTEITEIISIVKMSCNRNNDQEVKIHYIRMLKNVGSAGGQYEGTKRAYESGFDWVWLMDDDIITDKNALYHLIEAANLLNQKNEQFGFLCSKVIDKHGKITNAQAIDLDYEKYQYCQWSKFLEYGLVRIKLSTFVSMLISRNIISVIGLPKKEFFIWGEDTEYTLRISRKYFCYLVGKSNVLHKRTITSFPSIFAENDYNRIKNFYFMYRNNSYIHRKYYNYGIIDSLIFYCKLFISTLVNVFRILFGNTNYKFLKIKIILRGRWDSMFFDPL